MQCDPVIVQLLQKAEVPGSPVVAIVDEILTRLEAQHAAYRSTIEPMKVGVHPANRDGYGVSEPEVHALGAEIVGMGFSFDACAHAVCVEDDPQATIAKYTIGLQSRCEGLARPSESQIQFGSLSCTHTNQFLAAVVAGVPTPADCLAIDGRMSRSRLSEQDQKLGSALTSGIPWLVIKHGVTLLCPTLATIVQAAKNKPGHAQRRESEVQTLLRIHSMAAAQSSISRGAVDWKSVQAAIAKRSSQELEDIPDFIRFVQRWGGGNSGVFIKDLSAFHQLFVPSGRVIGASTFKWVGELRFGPDELVPHFATAIIKTQATGPKTLNRVCCFLSSSDIASIEKEPRKSLVLEAEGLMRDFRKTTAEAKLSDADSTKVLGKLDTTIVRFVMKKPMVDKFDNLTEIANRFAQEVEGISKITVPRSWAPTPLPQTASASSADVPNFVQFEAGVAQGARKLSLSHSGFKVGTHVVSDDHVEGVIASISDDGQVNIKRGKHSVQVAYADFVEQWKMNKSPTEVLENWQAQALSANPSYKESIAKAHLLSALGILSAQAGLPQVKVQIKPSRGVFLQSALTKGKAAKLNLVPETQRIVMVKKGAEAPVGGVKCSVSSAVDFDAYLMPLVSSTSIVPFWHCRQSENPADATMALINKKVMLQGVCGETTVETEVIVPVLQNGAALKAGAELVVHRPPVAAPKSTAKRSVLCVSLDLEKGKKAKV